MKINRAALAAVLTVSGAAVVLPAASADAQVFESLRNRQRGERQQQQQQQQQQIQSQPGQREYELSREERNALAPVLQAAQANDWAAVQAALPTVQQVARSADARYLVGQIQLRMGVQQQNLQLQSQAIDAMIASGGAQPAEMVTLLQNQARFAMQANDTAKAQRALDQLVALNPNDPNTLVMVAQTRARSDAPGAIQLYQRAIQAQQAAGQPIPDEWRRQILALSYQARRPEAVTYARELLATSPTPSLWRDSLVIYRELGNADPALQLDIYRLMRAAEALTSERDFVEYAEAANQGAMFGEVKAVLEQGLARNAITGNAGYARQLLTSANGRMAEDRASLANERSAALSGNDGRRALRIADALYGYGQYAEAAELYRAALQKGGVDANLANTRLGAALAMAGQRAEAETAFNAVTGPRAELANFWKLWLSRRG